MAIGVAILNPASASSPDLAKTLVVKRTPEAAQKHARSVLPQYGWKRDQFVCLKELWRKESNWRPEARNKQPVKAKIDGSWKWVHAGGIPQILGMDPKTKVEDQIRRGLIYIEHRYQTPCRALRFHQANNWY